MPGAKCPQTLAETHVLYPHRKSNFFPTRIDERGGEEKWFGSLRFDRRCMNNIRTARRSRLMLRRWPDRGFLGKWMRHASAFAQDIALESDQLSRNCAYDRDSKISNIARCEISYEYFRQSC
jgi:hypothetical protein